MHELVHALKRKWCRLLVSSLEADDEAPILRLNQAVRDLLRPVVIGLVNVRDDEPAAVLARESKQEGARRSSGKLR